jgi:hypothetical protein
MSFEPRSEPCRRPGSRGRVSPVIRRARTAPAANALQRARRPAFGPGVDVEPSSSLCHGGFLRAYARAASDGRRRILLLGGAFAARIYRLYTITFATKAIPCSSAYFIGYGRNIALHNSPGKPENKPTANGDLRECLDQWPRCAEAEQGARQSAISIKALGNSNSRVSQPAPYRHFVRTARRCWHAVTAESVPAAQRDSKRGDGIAGPCNPKLFSGWRRQHSTSCLRRNGIYRLRCSPRGTRVVRRRRAVSCTRPTRGGRIRAR